MIKTLKKGEYRLIETTTQTKLLILDDIQVYAWIPAGRIGEILVCPEKSFKIQTLLSQGKYRLYEVKQEPDLTEPLHLELMVGKGTWQGYVLPTGLPQGKMKRKIMPTKELLSISAGARALASSH